jgi:hypothetical protein
VLGPRRNLGILSLEEKTKNLVYRSGCVKNWYQSMVTTLGLLGLMNESCKKTPFEVLLKRVTLYLNPLLPKVEVKNVIKGKNEISIVCMHLRNVNLCVGCE